VIFITHKSLIMIKFDIASYNTGNKEFNNCIVIMYLFDFTYLVSLRATLI